MSEADLLNAARLGDVAKVQRCLAAGVSVNCKDRYGYTPLHYAAWKGHKEVAALLLGAGAAMDAAAKDGYTPLHTAAWNGRKEVAALLLGAGAAVDAATEERKTPLYLAAKYGHKEVAALLLDAGAAVDAADKDGKTPADVCCAGDEADQANKGPILAALTAAAAARKAAGEASTDARHAEASGSTQATIPPAPTESAAAARHQAGQASLSQSMRDLHVGGSDQQEPAHDDDWQAAVFGGIVAGIYTWDVFISHAGRDADKPLALKLWDLLGAPGVGLRVFVDERSLRRGEPAGPQMAAAMKSSRVGLLLLSPEFFERTATRGELEVLFQRQGKQHIDLLPVFLRATVEECYEQLHASFPGSRLTFPVGIRHYGEPSARDAQARKPLEATMQEIVVDVCKMCCGGNWEKRYEAGLRKIRERNQR